MVRSDVPKVRPMRRRRRFLVYGVGALAAAAAAGRMITRRDGRRLDPNDDDGLGSLRGEPRMVRGPRASQLYTETYPGHGTVVFTHGYCLTEAVWHYQKRDLADDFGLVTWDLPGHGHSPGVAPGRLSLGFCADALARVIEAATDGNVLLVGHSLGGVISLAYLARHHQAAAERVRGAVLVSTPMTHLAGAVSGRWPGGALESKVVGRALQYVVQSDLAERVLGRDVGRRDMSLSYRVVRWGFGRDPSPSQVLFVRDAIASVRPDIRAETHRIMTDADVEGFLSDVTVPTLVVLGGRDRLVDPEESLAMAELLPSGRAVAFPEAGHAVFLEDHEGFNAELRRFAARPLVDAS